jgi:peptidoglycan/LPS O-acetylase OafA/YrhL
MSNTGLYILTETQSRTANSSNIDVEKEIPEVIIRHNNHFVGLRGIASLIVLVQHWNSRTWYGGNYNWLRTQVPINLFFNANLGLHMFFIITGRLIALKFLKSAQRGEADVGGLIRSFIKRPFRLFPITWFSVTLQWAACVWGWTSSSEAVQKVIFNSESEPPKWCLIGNTFWDAFYFSISMFTMNVIPGQAQALGSSNWAIPIFFFQSNLVYIVALSIGYIPRRQWLLLAFLILWFYYFESFAYPFLIGLSMALADAKGIWKNWQLRPLSAQIGFSLGCLMFVALSLWVPGAREFVNVTLQSVHAPDISWALPSIPYRLVDTVYLGNILSATALCLFCEVNRPTQRFLNLPILQWIGNRSVAIYLTHEFVIQTIMHPLVVMIHSSNPGMGQSLLTFLSLLILLPFVFLFAAITEILVSTPSMYFANVYRLNLVGVEDNVRY